ncbi:quinone oxidoreductase family protein [Xenophilus azovorans]|uniref:quinone oxidoreductase family protein n=1 Tax=Xenophilus azovorans TaxID=151755 RepID=UPI00056F72B1|nr:zinc-binding dehydrogenase [Xenophilus azovorans]
MRAIVVAPEGAILAERPMPEPQPNEVLVRVRAASLNRADLHVAAGHQHGRSGGMGSVIGIEWAGEVAAMGAQVPPHLLSVGDAVMCSGVGGYAEYACTDWGRVHRLPSGWTDFARASTLPIALQTSHDAITASGAFRSGQAVLVHGASSAVGLMAMQVARLLGASQVLGSSGNEVRRRALFGHGATSVVDSSRGDWSQQVLMATRQQGVDLVIDLVAGDTLSQSMLATRIGGRIVNVGRMGGFTGTFDFDLHSLRRLHYVGATFRTRSLDEVRQIACAMRADLWSAVADGRLSLPLSRTFALEDAAEALAHMRSNAHFGKLVLLVS